MATIYRCDRCKIEHNKSFHRLSVSVPVAVESAEVSTLWNTDYDLCNSCVRQLTDWLKIDTKKIDTKTHEDRP